MTVADSNLGGRQSLIIDGLQSDTNYELRMFASNAAGASSTTQNVYFSIIGKDVCQQATVISLPASQRIHDVNGDVVQCNLDGSNTDSSFTVDDSNSFLSP